MKISSFAQEHGLRRPSLDYYAFRGLPYAQYQVIQVIYALFYQLQALPHCSDDINTVRQKTHFWLKELQAAYTGTPTHPITLDLQHILVNTPLPLQEWVNIVTAIEMQTDSLLLDDVAQIARYGDRLYGSLYRMIAQVFNVSSLPGTQTLGYARVLLSFIQRPDEQGVRVLLPDNAQSEVYTLFETAAADLRPCQPLRVLARLYQAQAQQPMLQLAPLKTLWLSIRERLSS